MNARPDHARPFKGKAKNIPAQDAFLLPYQRRWIADKGTMLFMEKSRRIGISFATAYRMVREHSQQGAKTNTWISSRDEATARLVIKDCKDFARVLKTAAEDMGRTLIDKESVYSLSFSNGTEINSVAGNPDVFAGKGGNVLLDEFALRLDPRGVYSIALHTMDWGGTLAIVSTHRGSGNYFNQLAEEIKHKGNPKGFSHHRVTLQDALDQGFLWKLQSKLREGDPRLDMNEAEYFDYQRARSPDEESFQQECMCVPADDATAFLPYDLIAGCQLRHPDDLTIETEETRDYTGRKGQIRTLSGPYTLAQIALMPWPVFVGVDIGRRRDLTVLWCAARIAGLLTPLFIVEMASVEFARQELEFYRLLDLPNCLRACIDQTGIGAQFAERAAKSYGIYKAEGVTFTNAVKEQLAYPVRLGFEDRSLRIPSDDLVISDLRAIRKETTASGAIRFSADRGPNGHADRFWALALCRHAAAAAEEFGPLSVTSRPRVDVRSELDGYISGRAVRGLVESY